MYRHCIYCSADLKGNDALEGFPVGRTVAFDAAKGRLWAVCGRCGRWNLAPIEERWEPVEQAERAFRDSRLRVQSENIGLAKLPDGTRLIRVGNAVVSELAAWRYGRTLVQRRRQYLIVGAVTGVGFMAVVGGLSALGMGGLLGVAVARWQQHLRRQVVYRLAGDQSPDGRPKTIRRWHVQGAWLGAAEASGAVRLYIPDADRDKPKEDWWGRPRYDDDAALMLEGEAARRALSRSMVRVNEKGARRSQLEGAVALLERCEPEAYVRRLAREGAFLGKRKGHEGARLAPDSALALEMALHEDDERRALAGELAVLTAAWREAEEIAAIADALATRHPLPADP